VDDASTAELMARFYKEMLGPEKLRPAAALREAQSYVRSRSRWEDPYYRAGFVLLGDWR
jgi:CHAT domain-containing protein